MKLKSLLLFSATFVIFTLYSASCEKFEPRLGNIDGDDDIAIDGDEETESITSKIVWLSELDTPVTNEARRPRNIHLTYQQDPSTTITMQWAIDDSDIGGKYNPRIWVVKKEDLDEGAAVPMPFAVQYTADGQCEPYREEISFKKKKLTFKEVEGDNDVFVFCDAEITGLEPYTEYVYRVGGWEDFDFEAEAFVNPDLSEMHSFKTGRSKGDSEGFTFIAAGDSRGGYAGIAENIDTMVALGVDFWVFNGDMNSYGTQEEWNSWFEAMSPVALNTPIMTVQGNHEIYADMYYQQFSLPRVEALGDFEEHGWTFDYGNTRFIGLNSNTEDVVEAQAAWMENELKEASEDEDIIWKVVMFHHPAYSACKHGSTSRVQDIWLPIFEKYNVDLTFSGHDHNYERTYPIRGDQVVEAGEGVVHVVAGGFFSPGYSNGSDWWTASSSHGDLNNYVVISIDDTTLTATAYTGDGVDIVDEFTLTK